MYEGKLRKILTDGESKVYLALLQLGSSTVGPVVEKSKVAYSNIYEILNRLIEKGLVSFVIKAKTKYFQAAPPTRLLEFIDKKQKELIEEKKNIDELMPKLEEMQKFVDEKLQAEVFVGIKGLKTAYEKLIKEHPKEEYFWFYVYDKEVAEVSDNFYIQLYKEFRFKSKGISNKEYKKSKYPKIAKKNEIRFVDFPIVSNVDISKDSVLIVSWKPTPTCFYINSKDIANKMRDYFYSVWRIAKG